MPNTFRNDSTEDIPAYGLMRVVGSGLVNNTVTVFVDKPDGSGGHHVINGPLRKRPGAFGSHQDPSNNLIVLTDVTTGNVGPENDSWVAIEGSMFEVLGPVDEVTPRTSLVVRIAGESAQAASEPPLLINLNRLDDGILAGTDNLLFTDRLGQDTLDGLGGLNFEILNPGTSNEQLRPLDPDAVYIVDITLTVDFVFVDGNNDPAPKEYFGGFFVNDPFGNQLNPQNSGGGKFLIPPQTPTFPTPRQDTKVLHSRFLWSEDAMIVILEADEQFQRVTGTMQVTRAGTIGIEF